MTGTNTNKRLKSGASALLLGLAMTFSGGASAGFLVDSFNAPSQPIGSGGVNDTTPDGTPNVGSTVAVVAPNTSLSNVMRTLETNFVSEGLGGSGGTAVQVDGGLLAHIQGSTALGTSLVTYSFDAYDFSALNPLKLGIKTLNLDVDGGPGDMIFRMTLTGGGADVTESVPVSTNVNFPGTSVLTFDFTGAVGNDLMNVTGLLLEIDGSAAQSSDVSIDFIAQVPEPATLGLLGGGLMLLGGAVRRRRQKA